MKNLLENGVVKAIAFLLALVSLFVAIVSGIVSFVLLAEEAYEKGKDDFLGEVYQEQVSRDAYTVLSGYRAMGRDDLEELNNDLQELYSPENSNYGFRLYDAQGLLLLANSNASSNDWLVDTIEEWVDRKTEIRVARLSFENEKKLREFLENAEDQAETYGIISWGDADVEIEYDEDGIETFVAEIEYEALVNEGKEVCLKSYLRTPLVAHDRYYELERGISFLYRYRFAPIWMFVLSSLVSVALLGYLFCAVGHKKGVEGRYLSWISRTPFDLFTAVIGAGMAVSAVGISELFWRFQIDFMLVEAVVIAALAIGMLCLALLWLLSAAARWKYGKGVWWRNTVCFRLFRGIVIVLKKAARILKKVAHILKKVVFALPLLWRALSAVCVIGLLDVIFFGFGVNGDGEVIAVYWVIKQLVLLPLLFWILWQMRKLQTGGARIANGEIGYAINTKGMWGVLRTHGENLNNIRQGIRAAVEEQMKSERMKTELITNVSHDIKTPLTSIVNYVDLLKKEDVSETAAEYIAVLDRQSARLKKLTEDLMEASKASSGTLMVTKAPTDGNLLLGQALGEYEEKLSNAGLELIVRRTEKPTVILADGRLLWRVFDNLLNNICKYAQPATRVYVESAVCDGVLEISFKNISAYALNISSDELMERFVRGDASRSTEGSGLGLSIAKSLKELQGGTLTLAIDADLFKASVAFPLLPEDAGEAAET